MIAGGIPGDTLHGRMIAGTLDSVSSCPCRARLVPSIMEDSYEKGGQSTGSTFSLDGLFSALEEPYKSQSADEHKDRPVCTHIDGAIQVAQYILSEIKANVKSTAADMIRNFIDEDTLKTRYDEWMKLPFYARFGEPPQPDLPAAMAIWYQKVKTGAVWDHKPKIRDRFGLVAVARPLPPPSNNPSKSYFHKYKYYDYFYDVWSNIHYGYVGLSVGFSVKLLLQGSNIAQLMTPGTSGNDTEDDITSMHIGFELFRKHGRYANDLSCEDILNALDDTSGNRMSKSKQVHWCWNDNNPERTEWNE